MPKASSANLAEQLTVRQVDQSHTAGFEAWMRSRGSEGVQTFTSDDIISQFGVVKGSYESVALPAIKGYSVKCQRAGLPKEVLTVDMEDLQPALEWGEVLVSMRMMPINPADLYTIQTGGVYGNDSSQHVAAFPFCPGHDGVGIVLKNGPGVKDETLREGDWVIPMRANLGTWQSLAVMKEKDLLVVPRECMSLDQLAVVREMITAYRLLEDANLKPGDCVLLNGASGTVGQLVVQLCHLLRLRAVAVVSAPVGDEAHFEKTAAMLTKLGAVHVVKDQGSVKLELNKLKFFAKPKLGLDCIGGDSSVRLSEALAEGAQLVIYGCMSGKSPSFNWKSWVFGRLSVKGFNTRRWMTDNVKKVPALVDTIGKLVRSGKLAANVAEYELGSEFDEALDHAMDRSKNVKVLLRVSDVGEHA
jgi:trans-2-enoyl-CoA reductase